MEQGVVKPCFFVKCENASIERFMGRRYRHSNKISIKYYSKSTCVNDEYYIVGEKLSNYLECIDFQGDLLLGKVHKYEVNKNELVIVIEYNYFVYKDEELEKMVNLKVIGGSDVKSK